MPPNPSPYYIQVILPIRKFPAIVEGGVGVNLTFLRSEAEEKQLVVIAHRIVVR